MSALQDRLDTSPQVLSLPKALVIGLILAIALGIGFRVLHLDKKIYWLDETHTSLRIYGYTEPEFIADIFRGEPVKAAELLEYQQLSPNKTWNDTLQALAGNSEHAPLYYLLLRGWSSLFGTSVAAIRSLSALIGLLCLPFVYGLGQELFRSRPIALIATTLFSVSPFHVLYAQEARPYSLLTLAIAASSAALLRALRTKTRASWVLYGLAVTVGCYTHWLFGSVVISHGLYVLCMERFRVFSRAAIAYLLAALAAVIAFTPWIWITVTAPPALQEQMGWIYEKTPLPTLLRTWAINISRIVFDLDIGPCWRSGGEVCTYPLSYRGLLVWGWTVPIVVLVGYAFYHLIRHASPRIWLFLCLLASVMALAAIAPDMLSNGQRSTVLRYLIPCVLSVQLTLAYFLSVWLNKPVSSLSWPVLLQRGLIVAVVSAGLISCVTLTQLEGGWTKGGNYRTSEIATLINQAERPLLVFSVPETVTWGKGGAVGRVVPLARLLAPTVDILFVVEPTIPSRLPTGYQTVFLYRPSDDLRAAVARQQNAAVEPAYQHALDSRPWLWQVKSPSS